MLFADEHLGVEQQAGLQHAVHGLVGTVYRGVAAVFLGQRVDGLVELTGYEVVYLLA